MTQKILYAVQSKQIEDVISRSLTAQTNGAIVSVGSAGYREQVLPSLKQTGADILLYREGLKGGTDIFELMKSVRENFPEVRIIFMANKQPTTSKLLCSLVFLGIYDTLSGAPIWRMAVGMPTSLYSRTPARCEISMSARRIISLWKSMLSKKGGN